MKTPNGFAGGCLSGLGCESSINPLTCTTFDLAGIPENSDVTMLCTVSFDLFFLNGQTGENGFIGSWMPPQPKKPTQELTEACSQFDLNRGEITTVRWLLSHKCCPCFPSERHPIFRFQTLGNGSRFVFKSCFHGHSTSEGDGLRIERFVLSFTVASRFSLSSIYSRVVCGTYFS